MKGEVREQGSHLVICAQADSHLQTHDLGSRLILLEVEFLTCRREQALGTEPGGECP